MCHNLPQNNINIINQQEEKGMRPRRVRGFAANQFQIVFPATCAVEKLSEAKRHASPRAVVKMGLLHDAAALRRDGFVSAPPFFLSKSKLML